MEGNKCLLYRRCLMTPEDRCDVSESHFVSNAFYFCQIVSEGKEDQCFISPEVFLACSPYIEAKN